MTGSLLHGYRAMLLKKAWQRGFWSFISQSWLIFADSFLRKKEIVFHLDAQNVSLAPITLPDGLQFQEISRWEDLPASFRTRVMDPNSDLEWSGRTWFDKNRRLWVGIQDGAVATLGWWCGPEEAALHFFPIPAGAELFLHATTLPEYRGRNLHRLLRQTFMQARRKDGVTAFYAHVRDYNTPSRRNIVKMGFKPVGKIVEWRH